MENIPRNPSKVTFGQLLEACWSGDIETVQVCLSKGLKDQNEGRFKTNPIHWAIVRANPPFIAQSIAAIIKGMKVTSMEQHLKEEVFFEIVKILSKEFSLEKEDQNGCTPIMYAVIR
jgi:hypothetical protein